MTPYRLVSLWEMLEKYSADFSDLMVWLFDIEASNYALDQEEQEERLSAEQQNDLNRVLSKAVAMTENLDLDSGLILARRMQQNLLKYGYARVDLYKDVADLRSRIEDQLRGRLFYFVPPAKTHFYQTPYLFGEDVYNLFPKAADDIEDAGKCLALGLGTSSVMHLMRVMECGLKGLAKSLKIPYAPSWESYLKQIQAKIDENHKKKSVSWKKVEKFYRDVSGELLTVKQAWRNPTMHIERRYSLEEAEEVFKAVKSIMQRFSIQFNEDGKRIPKKK